MHKKLKSILNRQPRPTSEEYAVVVCRKDPDTGEETGSLVNRTQSKEEHEENLSYWRGKIDRPHENIVEVHAIVRTIKTSQWGQMP